MKRVIAMVLSMAIMGSVIPAQGQQGATDTTKKKVAAKPAGTSISGQLSQMKEAIEAQQQQIEQLSHLIQSRDEKIQQLEQRLDQSQTVAVQAQTNAKDAQAKADTAAAEAAAQGQTVAALNSDVSDMKLNATNSAMTLQETQKRIGNLESPLAIHFKGVTLTPGGFLAAESVYRTRALAADINTPFNNVNMPGAGQNGISEFYGSGRQSRISLLAEGKLSDIKMTGYYEADFLSAGVTSNNNQSNSYTMRQRQLWGQAAFNNGWTFTGGQMWSLATETKKGVDNRTEALPMTIDPAYTVGFTWERQYGVRISKNFNNRFWLAAALENPQTIFAASGNASNFAFGSPGAGGGLYNLNANYSFNAMPDVVLKAVFEPGFGHYEVFGILSRYRDRVYPCVEFLPTNSQCTASGANAATGAYNSSKNGGGLGANARVTLFKQLDFGLHGLFGNGVGRYGTAGLPDATVNPDGTLATLRSYQGLATLEWHTKRLDFYMNGGEEYVGRRFSVDSVSGKTVGYGAPAFVDSGCYTETPPSSGNGYGFGGLANCSGNTQSIVEGTVGFWIKIHTGERGRLQFGPQYSYVSRNAWAGTGSVAGTSASPHGIDNMFFTSFRYYLP